MKLQLNFDIEPSKSKIGLQSKIVTIGSCFSDNIGNQLVENKIDAVINPFGTVFNPSSIFKLLINAIQNTEIDEGSFVENDGIWYNYNFHSKNNNLDREQLKTDLENIQIEVGQSLKTADYLIITLGTSFAYQLLESEKYVANCHKMPSNLFRKDLLHVKHICQEFEHFYKKIKAYNLNINIVLTVSPVRHTKDGIPENQVSKSIVRAACHYLCLDFVNVSYFPAYEIMMDELRDYRFYEEDLIHPNQLAIDYIFERFSATYFDEKLIAFLKKWTKIKADLQHRPFNEKSVNHQKFIKSLLQKLEDISEFVDVEKEKEAVLSRIFV